MTTIKHLYFHAALTTWSQCLARSRKHACTHSGGQRQAKGLCAKQEAIGASHTSGKGSGAHTNGGTSGTQGARDTAVGC